jgi:hypothetical protein
MMSFAEVASLVRGQDVSRDGELVDMAREQFAKRYYHCRGDIIRALVSVVRRDPSRIEEIGALARDGLWRAASG